MPVYQLYNESFDQLDRFDNTKNRVKIKPVVVTEDEDFSSKHPKSSMLSTEVIETGEVFVMSKLLVTNYCL